MADPIVIIDADDLTTYLGSGDPADPSIKKYVELANGLVADAWAEPTAEIPTWVEAIALEAAGRAARNPKGLSSWSRAIDDASRTERLPDEAARAGVFLTAHEEAQLRRGTSPRRRRRFGSIRIPIGY